MVVINMINKKFHLLYKDIFVFMLGVLLMIIYSLYFKNNDTILVRSVFTFLSIVISIYSLYLSCHYISNKTIIYTILPVLYFCLFYIIYLLPCLGFIGHIGVNNNICMVFESMFGAKFLINISCYFNQKLAYKKVVIKNNTLKNRYDYSRIVQYFVIIYFCSVILGALVNIFINKIDMSIPYQLLFLHKSLIDI